MLSRSIKKRFGDFAPLSAHLFRCKQPLLQSKSASPVKGSGLPVRQLGGIFSKKDFKKKAQYLLIPQSSSMTAPFSREPFLSLRDISPHCGESPFTREPSLSLRDISPHRGESPYLREPENFSAFLLCFSFTLQCRFFQVICVVLRVAVDFFDIRICAERCLN